MKPLAERLLAETVRHYLTSGDFNGFEVRAPRDPSTLSAVRELVASGKVDAIFEDADPNPAVKRTAVEPLSSQLNKLSTESASRFCLYPTAAVLAEEVDRNQYSATPYSLELALGAPQLAFRAFDLTVLEHYRNDPRYYYRCDDVHGTLAVSDDYFRSPDFPERDKVLIQSFGFAYSADFERSVAVFLCDLAGLSPEHQQVWRAKELAGEYRLHPDFESSQLFAEFPTHIPIFAAFLLELETINRMAAAMGRAPLFRTTPDPSDPPRRFGFLIRPTRAAFEEFVLTLDKLISDNISKTFFGNDVPDEDEVQREDGKVVVQARGTLRMLEDWFRTKFRAADWAPFEQVLGAFRKVRKLRQKPAHAPEDDRFDQKLIREQRELIIAAYTGVRTLRLALANHPGCAGVEVDPVLFAGRIRDF